jgi:hypothetical protein
MEREEKEKYKGLLCLQLAHIIKLNLWLLKRQTRKLDKNEKVKLSKSEREEVSRHLFKKL